MTTKEIRDKLMMEKIKNENARAAIEKSCNQIKKIQSEIKDEDIAFLRSRGISIDPVLNLDLDNCKSDPEYLEICKKEIELTVAKLHEMLEGEFGV